MRQRGFEIVTGWQDKGIQLPQRKTAASAGYDLAAGEAVTTCRSIAYCVFGPPVFGIRGDVPRRLHFGCDFFA